MRTLVTGITGFVGRHLAAALVDAGDEVLGLGYDPGVRRGSRLPAQLRLEQLDLGAAAALTRVVADFSPERVLHLAAQSSPRVALKMPAASFRVNAEGTLNLLEALRRSAPSARLLFVSSSEVYGNPGPEPIPESLPLAPVNPYGASKAAAEILVAQYARCWGLPAVVARSFPHSGPGQQPLFALPSFARQIARIEAGLQEPTLQVGNLSAERELLDVEDVVSAYLLLSQRGRTGETYNVCSGEAHSIQEGLDTLLALSDRKIAVHTDPELLRPVDQPVLRGSAEKIRAEMGWRPTRTYRETLERLLTDWRQRTAEEAA